MTDLDLKRLVRETFLAAAEHHAVIGSTNDRGRELVTVAEVRMPYLVVADEQTAGRGRGTNRWWTGRGSLACSLLLEPAALDIPRRHLGLVSLAAALAVIDCLEPWLQRHPIGLRWPNDVYVGRRKLAGILAEALPSGALVLGIGLNLNNRLSDAPADLQQLAVSVCELSKTDCDRTAVLIRLMDHLKEVLASLSPSPAAIGRRADELCLQRGEALVLDTGQEVVRGQCLGIEADGGLRINTGCGARTFYAGVVRAG